jgi:hypothetical protein
MDRNQCKFGRNRAEKKVTIIVSEALFSPYLKSNGEVVTQTSHVAHNTHMPQPQQVWSISGSNEGHFTHQVEIVLSLDHASHSCGVTQTSYVAPLPHALQQMQICSKSGSKEGTLFLTPISYSVLIPPRTAKLWLKHHMSYTLRRQDNQCHFGRKRAIKKGTLFLQLKHFFVFISLSVAAGWIKHHTWTLSSWVKTTATLVDLRQ